MVNNLIYIIYDTEVQEIHGTLFTILDYFLFLKFNNFNVKLLSPIKKDFLLNIIKQRYIDINIENSIININNIFDYSKLIKKDDLIISHFHHYLDIRYYINRFTKKIIIHSTRSFDLLNNYRNLFNEEHFNEDELIGNKINFNYNKYIKKIFLDGINNNKNKIKKYDIYINFCSSRYPMDNKIFSKYFYELIKNKKVFITISKKLDYLNNYKNIDIYYDFINLYDYDFNTYIYYNENSRYNIPDNSCRNIIEFKYFNKNIIYLNSFNIKDGAYYRYIDTDINKYNLTLDDEIIKICEKYDKCC